MSLLQSKETQDHTIQEWQEYRFRWELMHVFKRIDFPLEKSHSLTCIL